MLPPRLSCARSLCSLVLSLFHFTSFLLAPSPPLPLCPWPHLPPSRGGLWAPLCPGPFVHHQPPPPSCRSCLSRWQPARPPTPCSSSEHCDGLGGQSREPWCAVGSLCVWHWAGVTPRTHPLGRVIRVKPGAPESWALPRPPSLSLSQPSPFLPSSMPPPGKAHHGHRRSRLQIAHFCKDFLPFLWPYRTHLALLSPGLFPLPLPLLFPLFTGLPPPVPPLAFSPFCSAYSLRFLPPLHLPCWCEQGCHGSRACIYTWEEKAKNPWKFARKQCLVRVTSALLSPHSSHGKGWIIQAAPLSLLRCSQPPGRANAACYGVCTRAGCTQGQNPLPPALKSSLITAFFLPQACQGLTPWQPSWHLASVTGFLPSPPAPSHRGLHLPPASPVRCGSPIQPQTKAGERPETPRGRVQRGTAASGAVPAGGSEPCSGREQHSQAGPGTGLSPGRSGYRFPEPLLSPGSALAALASSTAEKPFLPS